MPGSPRAHTHRHTHTETRTNTGTEGSPRHRARPRPAGWLPTPPHHLPAPRPPDAADPLTSKRRRPAEARSLPAVGSGWARPHARPAGKARGADGVTAARPPRRNAARFSVPREIPPLLAAGRGKPRAAIGRAPSRSVRRPTAALGPPTSPAPIGRGRQEGDVERKGRGERAPEKNVRMASAPRPLPPPQPPHWTARCGHSQSARRTAPPSRRGSKPRPLSGEPFCGMFTSGQREANRGPTAPIRAPSGPGSPHAAAFCPPTPPLPGTSTWGGGTQRAANGRGGRGRAAAERALPTPSPHTHIRAASLPPPPTPPSFARALAATVGRAGKRRARAPFSPPQRFPRLSLRGPAGRQRL